MKGGEEMGEKKKEVAEKVNKKKREGEGERNKVDSVPYPPEIDQKKWV